MKCPDSDANASTPAYSQYFSFLRWLEIVKGNKEPVNDVLLQYQNELHQNKSMLEHIKNQNGTEICALLKKKPNWHLPASTHLKIIILVVVVLCNIS